MESTSEERGEGKAVDTSDQARSIEDLDPATTTKAEWMLRSLSDMDRPSVPATPFFPGPEDDARMKELVIRGLSKEAVWISDPELPTQALVRSRADPQTTFPKSLLAMAFPYPYPSGPDPCTHFALLSQWKSISYTDAPLSEMLIPEMLGIELDPSMVHRDDGPKVLKGQLGDKEPVRCSDPDMDILDPSSMSRILKARLDPFPGGKNTTVLHPG